MLQEGRRMSDAPSSKLDDAARQVGTLLFQLVEDLEVHRKTSAAHELRLNEIARRVTLKGQINRATVRAVAGSVRDLSEADGTRAATLAQTARKLDDVAAAMPTPSTAGG
jgi:hypothetical protein